MACITSLQIDNEVMSGPLARERNDPKVVAPLYEIPSAGSKSSETQASDHACPLANSGIRSRQSHSSPCCSKKAIAQCVLADAMS
mmetsp:Transcript_24611/g.38570  ORF Transcript_24611/g.38570 Transcript_24611/m.38570 type:complete len:85 (+) Transcript_24611:255-509(+)